MPTSRFVVSLIVSGSCGILACRAAASGPVIDHYRMATCLTAVGTDRSSRRWENTVTLRDGVRARVEGLHAPSGRVVVRYSQHDEPSVVAAPDYYIYPSDLRFDSGRTILYVKADGFAAGLWRETWLYEYDLQERRTLAQLRVDAKALPPECPFRPSP
jgi:hypothetical protein